MGNWGSKNQTVVPPTQPSNHLQQTLSSRTVVQTASASSHSTLQPTAAQTSSLQSSYSSNNTTRTSASIRIAPPKSPSPPAVARPATQTVKHYVNNDYIIPKSQPISQDQIQTINIPHRSIADKFGLRICPQYNSRNGCNAHLCRRYHVCLSWVKEQCNRDACDYDHSLDSNHNASLERAVWTRRGFNTMECLKENHKRMRRTRNVSDVQICVFNIMNRCTRTDCQHVHSKTTYQWEVQVDNKWSELSFEQRNFLEKMYSLPDQEQVKITLTGTSIS